jgi:hypothetical protein
VPGPGRLPESPGQLFFGADGKLPACLRPPIVRAWHRTPKEARANHPKEARFRCQAPVADGIKFPVPGPGRLPESPGQLFLGSDDMVPASGSGPPRYGAWHRTPKEAK